LHASIVNKFDCNEHVNCCKKQKGAEKQQDEQEEQAMQEKKDEPGTSRLNLSCCVSCMSLHFLSIALRFLSFVYFL